MVGVQMASSEVVPVDAKTRSGMRPVTPGQHSLALVFFPEQQQQQPPAPQTPSIALTTRRNLRRLCLSG
jgi:hypothetical protein